MPHFSLLAVDDEQFNLDLLEAVFSEYDNIHLTFAISGQEALTLLETNVFDLVLLDISMPEMDGLEVLQKIRAQERFNNLPILMVTANGEREKEALALGANDFIQKPYDIEILYARTFNYAKLSYFTQQLQNQNEILEEKVAQRTKELQAMLQLAKETEFEISVRLGKASESRDPDTGGHIKRMSYYSKLLAELYGFSKQDSELLLYAAPLHDIGKIGIPDAILLKAGRFDDDEMEIMKTHSQLGADMLDGAQKYPVLNLGKKIALEHHEKYDGSGYPNGLKGNEISIEARIVAIADVFDALSSKRCYKEPMPLETVLGIMKKDAGTHFDPELIELFLGHIDEFLEIKEKYKDEE